MNDIPLHRGGPDKSSSHVSIQEKSSTSVTITIIFSGNCFFSMVYEKHVVRFQFLTLQIDFVMNVFFSSQDLQTLRTPILVAEKAYERLNHELHRWIVTICCAAHANVLECTYCFNNENVKGVDCYQMLHIYNRTGAQQFPKNAVFQLYGAPSHI